MLIQKTHLEKSNVTKRLVTRFAPSPTGFLHLGHIASAIYVWGIARAMKAKIILRIEDHDTSRCRQHFEEAILKDLEWLGFIADEGVEGVTKPSRFRQSDCQQDYLHAIKLLQQQKLLYYCDCSRQTITQQMLQAGVASDELCYLGHCRERALAARENTGLRMQIESENISFRDLILGQQTQDPAQQCGDLLLKDRDGQWTYQLAVTVDDLNQGVNLIVRGADLLLSTARQIKLAEKLRRDTPALFGHHPLLLNAAGEKLSKRLQSEAVATYRQNHASPQRLLANACQLLGLISYDVSSVSVSDLPDFFQTIKTFKNC